MDSASSASFINELLAQLLRLPRRHHNVKVTGIGDSPSTSRGIVRFDVARKDGKGKRFGVEAIVLSKGTSTIPSEPVSFNHKWNHLQYISLADPDFGKPGNVNLLLGSDMFSILVLHGRQFGPSGSPYAFKKTFGWVLAGSICSKHTQCHMSDEYCFL